MDWLAIEVDEIRLDEGERLEAYLDTLNIPTIGVGHTAGVQMGDVISRQQSYDWLKQDVQQAYNDARSVCSSFDELSDPRKGVLVNMAFNLGGRKLSTFKNTLRYINEGNYEQAASNMLQSLWARQVGRRADRLASRMKDNQYAAR